MYVFVYMYVHTHARVCVIIYFLPNEILLLVLGQFRHSSVQVGASTGLQPRQFTGQQSASV